MDIQKDIRQTQSLTGFFEKQARTEHLTLARSVERLYRRGERIVAAIYMATNHIPQEESLRLAVRAAALRMLQDILALRDEMRSTQSPQASAFRASSRYLVSLLRMLSISGFVSMQNTNILIEALDELGNFLRSSQQSALSEDVSFFKQDFLDASSNSLRDIKDMRNIRDKSPLKDGLEAGGKKALDVRKQNILELLRGGVELGIAEIAANLPEYSSKTIQRDLVDLIASKHIKRIGLKRWSKYSLIA